MNGLLLAVWLGSFWGVPGAASQSIESLGPSDATITVLIDGGAVRSSPHRGHYEHVMAALPDYPRLVGAGKINPVDVFDRVLVSSSNPRRLTETVLVASVDDASRGNAYLDTAMGQSLRWRGKGGYKVARPEGLWWVKGDPRVLMRKGKVFGFAHPRHGKWFSRAARKKRGADFPPPVRHKGALLVAHMKSLPLGLGRALPTPTAVQLVLEDGQRPQVTMALRFADAAAADNFVARWPGVQRELVQHWELAVLGYTKLVARIEVRRSGEGATMVVRAEPVEVQRLSRFLATTIRNRTRAHHPPPRGR